MVAYLFLSTPTARHWFVQLYFSQPDFVFVTGSLICICRELTLYFSPKHLISQCGIILEPAVGYAFSKGQNPSELNFQSNGHVFQPSKSFAAVLGPIWCLKVALEGLSRASKRRNILPSTQETAHATNFHKTIYSQSAVEISAVIQVRCLKFWT